MLIYDALYEMHQSRNLPEGAFFAHLGCSRKYHEPHSLKIIQASKEGGYSMGLDLKLSSILSVYLRKSELRDIRVSPTYIASVPLGVSVYDFVL